MCSTDTILDSRSSYSEQTDALASDIRPMLHEAIHQMQNEQLPRLEDEKKSEIRAAPAQRDQTKAIQEPVNKGEIECRPSPKNDFEM